MHSTMHSSARQGSVHMIATNVKDRRVEASMIETYVSAEEACELLGIKRQTLYAYASRGLIRNIPGEGRERRYRRDDVLRMRARSEARAGHAAVASGALRWGEPVLDTAISGFADDAHHYRGRSALELARQGVRFETV